MPCPLTCPPPRLREIEKPVTDESGDLGAKLTRERVVRVLGRIDDVKVAEIIASGASLKELEQAAAWALGESDVMAKLPDPDPV